MKKVRYILLLKKNKIEIIKSILERPELDINCKSFGKEYINSTITEAEISEVLLKHPENVDEETEETTLHVAVIKENTEIINLLVSNAYIDFEVTDKKGKRPIDITNNDTIKSLLTKNHQ